MSIWQVDRSRLLDFQACPRRRWLAYHSHGGKGIQRIAKALPLVFGSAFHEGCELMLRGEIEAAVLRARLYLSNIFEEKGVAFEGEQPANVAEAWKYGMEEQAAMAEALLRGFWAYEGETFLRDFDVLEVEQEGRAPLSGGSDLGLKGFSPEAIELMFRPDALVRDKMSGDLYAVSWKTCAVFSDKTVRQARRDMQSISEIWGRMNNEMVTEIGNPPMIEGVLYKFACKGIRRKDKWDGLYKQGSHLIYGWRKVSGTDEDWSWSYDFPNEEDPSKDSRLGKGWKRVPIWRDYPGGVSAWVAALAANEIFPRHTSALESAFPGALPVSRRADEIESWKRQIVTQEGRVRQRVAAVEQAHGDAEVLDREFPQHTDRCEDYSGCPMNDVCWNETVKADPMASGLYMIRTETNHPERSIGDE